MMTTWAVEGKEVDMWRGAPCGNEDERRPERPREPEP